MTLPAAVARLIETFDRNEETYVQGRYNETQLRREFIDPFFKALGWDVDNENGYAEAYKDVIHEDAIRIGQATKAPDYCFGIGGTRKFCIRPTDYTRDAEVIRASQLSGVNSHHRPGWCWPSGIHQTTAADPHLSLTPAYPGHGDLLASIVPP